MPISLLDAPPAGSQSPSFASFPPVVSSSGREAVELAREAGLSLDPWQEFVLACSLGERSDGRWLTRDVGLIVPRQNGKGSILEARELAGLFLFGERLLIHSAHLFDTSMEHFERMLALIEGRPDFERQIAAISRSHGSEGIKLRSGQRLRFKTRTKGGGRGFSCDCLVLDEAMEMPESTYSALRPTLSARDNPQVWHVGSAVDQTVHDNGTVLTRVRARGYERDPSLAFFEWAASELSYPDWLRSGAALDWDALARGNPSLGLRIPHEAVSSEQASMSLRSFAVERGGIGDWPSLDPDAQSAFDPKRWATLADPDAKRGESVVFGADVDQSRVASFAVAWNRPDGAVQVMLTEAGMSAKQAAARLSTLRQRWGGTVWLGGPSADLADDVPGAQVVSGAEFAAACGRLSDLVRDGGIRHGNQAPLNEAVAASRWRPAGVAGERSIQLKDAPAVGPLAAVIRALHGLTAAIDVTDNVW